MFRGYKLIILGLLTSIATGCALPKYNYIPVITQISEPPLTSINTAYIGDQLLRQRNYTEHDAIFLGSDHKVGLVYTLKRGYYLKTGEDAETEFYLPATRGTERGAILKAALADP